MKQFDYSVYLNSIGSCVVGTVAGERHYETPGGGAKTTKHTATIKIAKYLNQPTTGKIAKVSCTQNIVALRLSAWLHQPFLSSHKASSAPSYTSLVLLTQYAIPSARVI